MSGYTRIASVQLAVALAVTATIVWVGGLPWYALVALLAVGLLLGYRLGTAAWARSRSRIDRRNVLILYFSDTAVYLVIVLLYLAKSFPFGAGRTLLAAWSYPRATVGLVTLVASSWCGFRAGYLRGVTGYEREHGPLRTRTFHAPSVTGEPGMIGIRGRVVGACEPAGKVEVRGEIWNATSLDGSPIPLATRVIVRDIEGLELVVEPATGPAPRKK